VEPPPERPVVGEADVVGPGNSRGLETMRRGMVAGAAVRLEPFRPVTAAMGLW
jgi:hypothetical protein